MVVTISSTVNLIFGSRVMDPVTGILFNDEVCGIIFMKLERITRIVTPLDG